ncbi:MAG TPA: phenylalanine--tRNA ligase subunit beta [Candidatus Saccharimonadales bacterium]|nr:phenylalanine--tRNA ligase subunit beta [Candidatus Saccharimonadales bacterium]
MKISTQALKFINEHYGSAGGPAANGVDDLVQRIGSQLGAVEEVVDNSHKYDGAVVVKIVSCVDHPDSDHLHICMVDDGGVVQNVERDAGGLVQVITGAPNVHADFTAVWLPPGSTVPDTFGTPEPFVLEARPLRGKMSYGMLASARELGLGDDHNGILEISGHLDEHQVPAPGTSFGDAYHLTGDVIIDMENKMFTHRPDCFGWLGIAREIEGIYHRPYKSPPWYTMHPEIPGVEADELKLEVRNEIPELVPRFTAIVLRDVEVKQSPVWLQADLARAGIHSINNIVDYSNFFMLETGQPIHIYDYDKVAALSEGGQATLVVRKPHEGEQIALLNGKTITPRAEAMMVATPQKLICVGGAMGGTETEVDAHTKNVIIEAASWDMYSMRRTSMAHGIFTDAVTRFTKGQSPLQNLAVVAKITDEIRKFAGGKVASPLVDDNHVPAEALERGNLHAPVQVPVAFINARLGLQLSAEEMQGLLTNVEFRVEIQGDGLVVTAPFWRTDIEIKEDVVEEVGRLYGYDHLPLELPKRTLLPQPTNPLLDLKAAIRRTLSAAGANEVLSYSFVHGNVLDKAGQDRGQAFQLSNALSPELQYFRLGLAPSLLGMVHPNIKAGTDTFGLFELGLVHNTKDYSDDELPREANSLAFVLAADAKAAASRPGAPYYQARAYLTHLLATFSAKNSVYFEPLEAAAPTLDPWLQQMAAPYDPGRSAVVRDAQGLAWGVVGEFRVGVRRAFKLPDCVAGFELDPLLFLQTARKNDYVPLPRFPKVEQDICLKVPAATPYAEVFNFVWEQLGVACPENTVPSLGPVDIYQRTDDAGHKQITLRLGLASYDRTLTDHEVAAILDTIAAAAQTTLHAERI